jgi:hypothetical protein
VRVNQVGYAPQSPKVAFVMVPDPVKSVSFSIDTASQSYRFPASHDDLGGWNSNYHAVYELNFSALHAAPGTYRIHVNAGGTRAESPAFRIASPGKLYHQLVLNAVRYFVSERDGADVVPCTRCWTGSRPT